MIPTPLRRRALGRATALTVLLTTPIGCSDDARVAEVATAAADRQAAQHEQLARVAEQAADGAKQLVAADAAARRDAVRLHAAIQQERQTLAADWRALETERQRLAAQRRTTSALTAALRGGVVAAIAALALIVAWFALHAHRGADPPADWDALADQLLDLPAANVRSRSDFHAPATALPPPLKENDP